MSELTVQRALTWVEGEIMRVWGETPPFPEIHTAQDFTPTEPALVDFTILDVRIGMRVWANRADAFVSHRLHCTNPFAGRTFQEMAELPADPLTLADVVGALRAGYATVLANVPRADPLVGPDTAEDRAADEAWEAERAEGVDESPGRYIGLAVGLAAALAAAAYFAWGYFTG